MSGDRVSMGTLLQFARVVEKAYMHEHGFDFDGMLYDFPPNRDYGWAVPVKKLGRDGFREKFQSNHPVLYRSDGSAVKAGEPAYAAGPITLIAPSSEVYQHDIIHSLAHQAFQSQFAFSDDPKDGKVSIEPKACAALNEGCAVYMPFDAMSGLMDARNRRKLENDIKKYRFQLNRENGFEEWHKARFTRRHYLNDPDFTHAVGYNFVLQTWEVGAGLSDYFGMLKKRIPTSDDMISPSGYLKRQ